MKNDTKKLLNTLGITLISGSGVADTLPSALKERDIARVFILADKNTYLAAGERVEAILAEANIVVKKYVFSNDRLEPNESAVGLAVMHFDPTVDAVVGVGSGVINDISKILAHTSGKPYIIVATAPSMDGYASASSSMSVAGLKISLPSTCPDIIVGDTDILCAAPQEMLLAGLGDMLAKYVAICEWRISNLINSEEYRADVADLVRASLQKCVQNADGLLVRDEAAVAAVFEGLALCGAAMKIAGTSRPASGVEHYLSHVWDMRGEEFGTPVELHGLQCAVGTYIAVTLYEKIKRCTPDRAKATKYAERFDYPAWAETLRGFVGKGAESMIALEAKEGKYDPIKHEARLDRIIQKWDDILQIIDEEIPPLSTISALYDKVGLPKSVAEIGIDEEILPLTFKTTKDIRDKYVLSRLCFDLGVIDEILIKHPAKEKPYGSLKDKEA